VHLLFPQIPIALSVGSMMAAVPAALLPIPFSLSLLTILIAGLDIFDAIPVMIAALTGFLVVQGLGLLRRNEKPQKNSAGAQNEHAPAEESGSADDNNDSVS